MESTVNTFVRMLHERECGVVVMLCGCGEGSGGVEMCTPYWPMPAGTTANYGKFSITSESIDENNEVIQRALSISDIKVVTKGNFHLTHL